jgi:hypothetical protein
MPDPFVAPLALLTAGLSEAAKLSAERLLHCRVFRHAVYQPQHSLYPQTTRRL